MNMNQWQNIFNWSIRQQDDTQPPQYPERTEEERQFLRNALEEATVDPIQRMKQVLEEVQNKEITTEQKEQGLEELVEFVEQIDFANDFYKLGGLPVMVQTLNDSDAPSLNQGAAEVIATCIQNNHHLKQLFFQDKILDELLKVLSQSHDAATQGKLLLAISSLIRDFPLAQQQFIDDGGIQKLISIVNGVHNARLSRKAITLITHLMTKDDQLMQYMQKSDVDRLIDALKVDDRDMHEAVLQLLSVLCKDKDRLINQQKLKGEISDLQKLINSGGQEKIDSEMESLELCKVIEQQLDAK